MWSHSVVEHLLCEVMCLGHSGDEGNDHADDRVQWGKGEGPYCRFALDGSYEGDPDSCLPSRDENTSSLDSGPGLLDVISCSDIGNTILDGCGVIDLAKLSIACKPAKEAVQLYNRRAHRIFPVRCGGFDHESFADQFADQFVCRPICKPICRPICRPRTPATPPGTRLCCSFGFECS